MPKYAVVETNDWLGKKDPVPYCGSGDDIEGLCIGMSSAPGKGIPRAQLSYNTRRELNPCVEGQGQQPRQMTICDWRPAKQKGAGRPAKQKKGAGT
jgi:hypothetical protein